MIDKNENGLIWVKLDHSIFMHNNDVYVCHAYRPPSNSKSFTANNLNEFDFFETLESDIVKYDNLGYTFCTGDFNSRTADNIDFIIYDKYLDENQPFIREFNDISVNRASKDKVIDFSGRNLINLCQATGLLIANGRLGNDKNVGDFTFCSSRGTSVVDYLLLKYDTFDFIDKFTVNEFNEFSDHACISFALSINTNDDNDATTSEIPPKKGESKIIFDNEKIPLFQGQLMSKSDVLLHLSASLHTEPVESVVNEFSDLLFTTADTIFGKTVGKSKSTYKQSNKDWFNKECFDDKREFKRRRNIYNRNKTDDNRTNFIAARSRYNKTKKKAFMKFRREEGIKINNLASKNPRQFWKKIKGRSRKTNVHADTLTLDDLYTHFKNLAGDGVSHPNNTPRYADPNSSNTARDVLLDTEINETEIRNAIMSQNNNKCAGIDQIPAEIFKASIDIILPFMKSLYNHIFLNHEYPASWGRGIIAPVFKKGDANEAKNYRGITLINIIAKIYSQILLNRLTKWSVQNEKLTENQFGFQKGKSISDCIFILHSIIMKTLSEKEKLYCVFIDYQQFFDRIDHTFLWQKLLTENVSDHFVKALQAMYNCVKSCVRYQSSLSPFFETTGLGVKQGDPSSPLLAMFFINDLINNINSDLPGIITLEDIKLFLLFYADDMVLFAKSPESLRKMLHDVETYCNAWGLKINVSKTKAMIFENGRATHVNLYIYNEPIEVVNSFKYLGINLFKNGNFNRSQKMIAEHASFSLIKLYQIFNTVELPIHQKVKLFDVLVGSILNFCSEIWGMNPATDIEMIHVRFLRYILGAKKSTNLSALYGELGRVPLSIYRKVNLIKYWNKVISLKDNSLVKRTYKLLRRDDFDNKTYKNKNWASQVKTILNEYGFSDIWINESIDIYTLEVIKRRIMDTYCQSWYSEINNSPRLRTYAIFKHTFIREKYLDVIHEYKFRHALARFRISSHRLGIEIGRYTNTPLNDRVCTLCNMNQIESEYHFLLVCPKYRDLRVKFFKPYYCHWPNINKFENIMNSNHRTTIYNLSKFIFFATQRRHSLLN